MSDCKIKLQKRVKYKALLFEGLEVHVHSYQWHTQQVPSVQETDWQALSATQRNSHSLLWEGGQMVLLFLPSSCHSEVSVLHSHRLFVFVFCPCIAQCSEIWSGNLNTVSRNVGIQ